MRRRSNTFYSLRLANATRNAHCIFNRWQVQIVNKNKFRKKPLIKHKSYKTLRKTSIKRSKSHNLFLIVPIYTTNKTKPIKMSTENQEVTVEPAAEEKTETKEVKGTKRAAEVSMKRSTIAREKHKLSTEKRKILLISDSIIDVCLIPNDAHQLFRSYRHRYFHKSLSVRSTRFPSQIWRRKRKKKMKESVSGRRQM